MFEIALFRAAFPEFADIARYPDAMLTFWGGIASARVNANRWGTMAPNGVYLYVAHEITLAAQSASGGAAAGPIASKAVGSASISYDTSQAAEKDAGFWNLTAYGKQFIRLSRMFGAGGLQLK